MLAASRPVIEPVTVTRSTALIVTFSVLVSSPSATVIVAGVATTYSSAPLRLNE